MSVPSETLPPETLLEMQRRMLRIRYFDERASKMVKRGQIPGTVHTSIGQEAQVVGACMALGEQRLHVRQPPQPRPPDRQGRPAGPADGRAGRQVRRASAGQGRVAAPGRLRRRQPRRVRHRRRLDPDRDRRRRCRARCSATAGWRWPSSATAPPTRAASTRAMNIVRRLEAAGGLPLREQPVRAVHPGAHRHLRRDRRPGSGLRHARRPGRERPGRAGRVRRGQRGRASGPARGEGPILVEVVTYRFNEHSEGLRLGVDYRNKDEKAAWLRADPIVLFRARARSGAASPPTRQLRRPGGRGARGGRRAGGVHRREPLPGSVASPSTTSTPTAFGPTTRSTARTSATLEAVR